MEGSCWCQMDGAKIMPSQGLNIGVQMDQLDPKQLNFMIYLVLRMHQFQKYYLLNAFQPQHCLTIFLFSLQDSCQKGWRLFSIIAAYFNCSEVLKPYLFKYLETSAYDKRRAYHGTALVCLHNLRKTFKYGGRKNVPSIEEITAISAGRNSKRQIYRLPGGT